MAFGALLDAAKKLGQEEEAARRAEQATDTEKNAISAFFKQSNKALQFTPYHSGEKLLAPLAAVDAKVTHISKVSEQFVLGIVEGNKHFKKRYRDDIASLQVSIEDIKHTIQLQEEEHIAKIQKRNEELMQHVVVLSARLEKTEQALVMSERMHRDALKMVHDLAGLVGKK